MLILLADGLLTLALLLAYPKKELSGEAFYGGLKDYSLSEDGTLTVLSDDPWTSYTFTEPARVYSVRIRVSDISGPALRRAQVYLLPQAVYRDFELCEDMEAIFGVGAESLGVETLRLDLGSVEGLTLRLESVTINSRRAVALAAQTIMLKVLLVLAVIASALLALRSLAVRTSRRVPCLLIAAMELVVVWLLRHELLGLSYPALLLVLGMFGCTWAGSRLKKTACSGFVLFVPLSLMIFGLSETMSTYPFDFGHIEYLALSLLLCFLVSAVIYSLTGLEALSGAIAVTALGIQSIANYYYSQIRGAPLEYFDIGLFSTAMNVIDNYSFPLDHLSVAALLSIVAMAGALITLRGLRPVRAGVRVRAVYIGISAIVTGILIYLIPTSYMSTLLLASREEGYLLHFVSLIKMGRIERPEGYSQDEAKKILEEAAAKAAGKGRTPDIIVIMDESFADLADIYDFETDIDALPTYHALSEDTVKGYLLTSAYGGGTVMTEYEFLTGHSLYFFPEGTSPFVQYLSGERPSIATRLSREGYAPLAYHPYMKSSYNRGEAYERLGFERLYTIEDELPHTETIRDYVSDSADIANVIYLYEERDSSKPFFMFNVTMQNHGGYYTTGLETLVRPLDEEIATDELVGYLSLLHETDRALQELIDYFSGVRDEVIILFFGDHQPTEPVLFERSGDARLVPGMIRNYSSFLIWANFDIGEAEGIVTSPTFLRALLMEAAGLDLSPYEEFLLGASHEITSINAYGRTDYDSVWYTRGESETPLIEDYRTLAYAGAFDSDALWDYY